MVEEVHSSNFNTLVFKQGDDDECIEFKNNYRL